MTTMTTTDVTAMKVEQEARRTGRSAAGAKGGRATRALHGREFYSRIGRKGGTARGRKR